MLGLTINYEIKTEETNNAALLRYGKQKGGGWRRETLM